MHLHGRPPEGGGVPFKAAQGERPSPPLPPAHTALSGPAIPHLACHPIAAVQVRWSVLVRSIRNIGGAGPHTPHECASVLGGAGQMAGRQCSLCLSLIYHLFPNSMTDCSNAPFMTDCGGGRPSSLLQTRLSALTTKGLALVSLTNWLLPRPAHRFIR